MPTADYEKKVESVFEMMDGLDTIHPDNEALLREYRRDKELNGMSAATQQRNLSYLKILAEHAEDKRFEEMDESDVKEMVEWVHDRDLADETVDTYKKAIRSLWKWMSDGDETPEAIEWIQLNNSNGNGTLPKDLLSKEDIENQVDAAKNPRDKALIYMLYETGARIGELIDLTVGDIEDRKNGKKVVIEGKTGARRLPLVESVPHLNNWLNKHPSPEKDAPLWCKIQQGNPDDQLGYRYIREKILKKNMERADIDKPSNPHHYRHSRASYLATELKEAQLCEWFGWVQGSDVPARYVHLSGRDIDNAYDEMHGLYEPDDDEKTPDVVECDRCQELNEPSASFCMRCGFALDQETAAEVEEQTEQDVKEDYRDTDPSDTETVELLDAFDEALDDPEFKEELLRRITE
jgi:site-specific recombinase XerD